MDFLSKSKFESYNDLVKWFENNPYVALNIIATLLLIFIIIICVKYYFSKKRIEFTYIFILILLSLITIICYEIGCQVPYAVIISTITGILSINWIYSTIHPYKIIFYGKDVYVTKHFLNLIRCQAISVCNKCRYENFWIKSSNKNKHNVKFLGFCNIKDREKGFQQSCDWSNAIYKPTYMKENKDFWYREKNDIGSWLISLDDIVTNVCPKKDDNIICAVCLDEAGKTHLTEVELIRDALD